MKNRPFRGLFPLLLLLPLASLSAQFEEIPYPLLHAEPYRWELSPEERAEARRKTDFLELPDLSSLLSVDWRSDAAFYESVTAFFTGDTLPDPAYLILKSGIRVECYRNRGFVVFSDAAAGQSESVVLSKDGAKNHFVNRRVRDLFLPGNFVWRDLDGTAPHMEGTPDWPEAYVHQTVGDFSLSFTEADRNRVTKQIDWKRLEKLPQRCKALLGFASIAPVSVVVPPDLTAYAKLYVTGFGGKAMKWWPLSFHSMGQIVLWPLALPRYCDAEGRGEKFFWHSDLYRLIYHEYAHLAALERAGCLTSLPVWLDEGMAVLLSADVQPQILKSYPKLLQARVNDTAADLGLLSWDALAEGEAGNWDESPAQLLYLQSFAMVHFLIERYGTLRLSAYVESFRFGNDWKRQFESVYRLSWDENAADFNQFLLEQRG